MVYEHKNTRGVKYYLHKKGKLYYFAKEKKENAANMPNGYTVLENANTGLPMLKKKA